MPGIRNPVGAVPADVFDSGFSAPVLNVEEEARLLPDMNTNDSDHSAEREWENEGGAVLGGR